VSAGGDPPTLKMTAGRIHAADQPPESGMPFEQVLVERRLAALEAESRTAPDPTTAHQYSAHSFGAQFIEVVWDPGIARLRVSRALTVIDGGKIINHRTARNQILGAVVMGIGMALFEETIYDPRNAKPLNNNFADYIVPTNADIPDLDCIFVEYPDLHLNEYGARHRRNWPSRTSFGSDHGRLSRDRRAGEEAAGAHRGVDGRAAEFDCLSMPN
jgi:xanthine dehydrogenase YagR molybdenum-binding subunit